MTARLKVELFEQIRRAHRLDATVSIRELARRFGTHRRTVREALVHAFERCWPKWSATADSHAPDYFARLLTN